MAQAGVAGSRHLSLVPAAAAAFLLEAATIQPPHVPQPPLQCMLLPAARDISHSFLELQALAQDAAADSRKAAAGLVALGSR